ncbi:MAG: hypothetical protein U0575_03835 [Phycisphaerales bacterium]
MIALALALATAALAAPPDYVAYPEQPVVTTHALSRDGKTLRYEATAGTLAMVNEKRETTARMFYVSYRALASVPDDAARPADEAKAADGAAPTGAAPAGTSGASSVAPNVAPGAPPAAAGPVPGEAAGASRSGKYLDASTRPITFVFNGGPGSSSVWLQLGAFGPRRVDFGDAMGNPGPPPYRLVDNESTLLDATDLVFIDPIATGYSRAEGGNDARAFFGVENDLDSVAEFIRRFLTREERWTSPKYIAGESYGTTRAAGLSERLWQQHGIALNGIILVSAILDFSTMASGPGADLGFVLMLPSFAATAHFHGRVAPADRGRPLADFVADAEQFALRTYAPALLLADRMDDATRREVVAGLVRFTGLPAPFIEASDLRVDLGAFSKELLRDQRRTIGRLDGRFTGEDRLATGVSTEYDPSYAAIRGNFTACMNEYVRRELGYSSDLPYEVLTGVGPWDFGAENRYLNVAERLRRAMVQEPFLKVFVAMGRTDFATPYFAVEHTLAHMGLDPVLRGNITTERFNAGHMMYIDAAERTKLRAALGRFYGP